MKGKLYLIPTTLGESNLKSVLTENNSLIISGLKYFIVENLRSARRFIKQVNREIDIDALHFSELNEHTEKIDFQPFIEPLLQGNDVGVISEAGCPCTADPGAAVVEAAHRHNIKIVPMVGASSILLSLMASGFNGQNFAFNGYLPIEKIARIKKLKALENRVLTENQTQIFIETPYRNNALLDDIFQNLRQQTKLCVACELTTENEFIKTLFISDWKKQKHDFNKKPAIFLIYK
ncbi:MAG: SAM-dependent methyltransferase [Prevotellaceae bacterium]|jgi:16S rRNA (cytidine1402-2'-O)-methyltransferase|nr:SAM-dependent methyltransferase [Prevotellaceae bacterium]